MKKIYLLTTFLFVFILTNKSIAQTYSAFGLSNNGFEYDTIDSSTDTLKFTFTGLPNFSYGTAKLEIYYESNFDNGTQYLSPILEDGTFLDSIGVYAPSCIENIAVSTFGGLQISTWGGSTTIKLAPSADLYNNLNCNNNRAKVRLIYNYCITGVPVTSADLTVADEKVCPTDGNQTLVGTPTGGTFSGPGVSGSIFNPANLTTGNYDINYTHTDNIGCTTKSTKTIRVLVIENNITSPICKNGSPILDFDLSTHIFATDLGLNNAIDTATNYTFGPITESPSTYYFAKKIDNYYYQLDTFSVSNYAIIDHDNLTGDDNSGIAITDSTVYIVGDDHTGRFDLDLQNGVALPVMDGIFTDLAQRKIYTLYNTLTNQYPYNSPSDFDFNAIAELNADLTVGTIIIPLSQTISLNTNNSDVKILAGYNKLVVGNGDNSSEYFNIIINSGEVTSLGKHPSIDPKSSENWAIWGMSGYDGADNHAYYKDKNSGKIFDYNFTSQTSTPVSDFNDFSDMACFIVHPINHRMYFHYEYDTPTFGGNNETLGYIDAIDTNSAIPGGTIGCPASITYTFHSIDLGNDTTICTQDGVYVIEAGLGFDSYTWNGINNNWNIFPVQDSGQYIVRAIDAINCISVDTVVVDFQDCAGVNELALDNFTIYPIPSNGQFTISFNDLISNTTVELIDMNGRNMITQTVSAGANSSTINAKVQPGVYIVRISSDKGISQKTIVIQ